MSNEELNNEIIPEDINELIKVRIDKWNKLKEEGKDPFTLTKYDIDTYSDKIINEFDEMEGKEVTIAGRLMQRRLMGKAAFINIQDYKGRVQVYISNKFLNEEQYEDFKKLDIGDIVGVKGEVFKTQKGEISVRAKECILLSKSFQILPEKFHGLKDQDTIYRQRYLDLIMNQDSKDVFIKRSKIMQKTRDFLNNRDYLEVETSMLQSIPGGAAARPFDTHFNALNLDMHLRISLELPLKKLIVGGLDRVYEIGKVFRNEGFSTRHSPEFTSMELYQAYGDNEDMMEITESLIKYLQKEVNGTDSVMFREHQIDFTKPFARLSMIEGIKKYGNVDFNEIKSLEDARKVAKEHDIHFEDRHSRGEILSFFFEEYVEKHLIQPTFVIDHPVEISPLAKRKPDQPELTDRFELFIGGIEFANAFSELNDPFDQRARFEHQEALREAGDDEANKIDEDFLTSLEYGLPPTGGLGIGMDRLTMLLTERDTIRDVMLFPTMKPLGHDAE